jgi:hypothetical protein
MINNLVADLMVGFVLLRGARRREFFLCGGLLTTLSSKVMALITIVQDV